MWKLETNRSCIKGVERYTSLCCVAEGGRDRAWETNEENRRKIKEVSEEN